MADSLTRHTDYGSTYLTETEVDSDPIAQFSLWLEQAEEAEVYEPNGMVLGSVDADGAPGSRTVLLRTVDENGFEFFTDYSSQKGRALLAEPRVTLLFPWYLIHRQVIIRGVATPTAAEVSDAYFASRPRGSQIAATASNQSTPIASRDILEQRVKDLEDRYGDDQPIPRPADWGGFRVKPTSFEFWQGRTSRLHDRLRFTATDDAGWTIERLQP